MSKQKSFNTFRMMFPEFVYDSFHYETRPDGFHLSFRFLLGDKIVFEPDAFVPARQFLCFDQPKELLNDLAFHIGMIELISYWKACCPPTVVVRCAPDHFMDPAHSTDCAQQVAFWKKLYWNGLGEFFYVNNIASTFDSFLNFRIERNGACDTICNSEPDGECHPVPRMETDNEQYIVPIGGGKDSVVTLETLLCGGCTVRPLIMNPRGATTLCAEKGGFTLDDVIVIRRTIHPRLLELNKQGCLNGHTPFSAMLAFYTLLASAFSGIHNIALSNESSANESTVAGTNVNHQYSKSLEFENDFRGYVSHMFTTAAFTPSYFSFLRPLSELQIAMLFARESKYYEVFKSCNAGSKTDIWCCQCPKCLFAYIILSPFIAPSQLQHIFGKDLLNDVSLRHYFDQLIGHEETKPFECVGTISEVNSALSMTLSRWYDSSDALRPALLQGYSAMPPTTALNTLFDSHNLISSELDLLKNRIAQK